MNHWRKFAEPRGWALKWVFTQESAGSAPEQEVKNDDRTWEEFAEPRGWALKWDGSALSDAEKGQDESAQSPTVTSR